VFIIGDNNYIYLLLLLYNHIIKLYVFQKCPRGAHKTFQNIFLRFWRLDFLKFLRKILNLCIRQSLLTFFFVSSTINTIVPYTTIPQSSCQSKVLLILSNQIEIVSDDSSQNWEYWCSFWSLYPLFNIYAKILRPIIKSL
jgi:hypothetical protein